MKKIEPRILNIIEESNLEESLEKNERIENFLFKDETIKDKELTIKSKIGIMEG